MKPQPFFLLQARGVDARAAVWEVGADPAPSNGTSKAQPAGGATAAAAAAVVQASNCPGARLCLPHTYQRCMQGTSALSRLP